MLFEYCHLLRKESIISFRISANSSVPSSGTWSIPDRKAMAGMREGVNYLLGKQLPGKFLGLKFLQRLLP